jgi:hypothetical protein
MPHCPSLMPVTVAHSVLTRRPLRVLLAFTTTLTACSLPTDAPLVPSPEAVLWKQPTTMGFPRGEVGNGILFQTYLRLVNSRDAVTSGATVTLHAILATRAGVFGADADHLKHCNC